MQQLIVRVSRLLGRRLRCPRCREVGATLSFGRAGWNWRCGQCGHSRQSVHRQQLHDHLTTLITTGHALRARCFTSDDPSDLTSDVERWAARQEAVLRKRIKRSWIRELRAADAAARSTHDRGDATLDAIVAARLAVLKRILSEGTSPV